MADAELSRHVLLVNWRDTTHPDGGGSERYVERMARALVARGHRVTVHCAAHENAPADEVIDGVRFRRRGGRLSVYLAAILSVLRLRPDLVIDVQNGLPFFSPLVARRPVLVLVHHVHKEQWYAYLGHPLGGIGWWLESRLAPILYRRCAYVTVSETTARELGRLGVDRERITVIPCGQDPVPPTAVRRSASPRMVAVSRLVPHKRIEHAIDAVARLRARFPGLTLDVVGCGVWEEPLREYAQKQGVADAVTLHGWVSEQRKHALIA
ncbi:MAG: glycosyltransferase family 4 protein, partial [Thermocrispum sp.]